MSFSHKIKILTQTKVQKQSNKILPINRFVEVPVELPVELTVGCSVGHFAAHAAALGARVECYETTPNYCKAVTATAELNRVSHRLSVHNIAIGEAEEEK